MPSPFPGMDPYVEAFGPWRDFHGSFIVYMRDALQPLLRPKYRARGEERILVDPDGRTAYPDVSIIREPVQTYGRSSLATSEYDPPVVVEAEVSDTEPYQAFLQIILPVADGKLVTVIEVISPSNGVPGETRRKYEIKQQEILASDVSLVEIDLLLGGSHVAAVHPQQLERLEPCDYVISVSRASDRKRFELYPVPLSGPLPRIAVPLLPDDKDVALDLQAMFDRAYEGGAYEDDLDYTRSLPLPVSSDQEAWIRSLLEGKGLVSADGSR